MSCNSSSNAAQLAIASSLVAVALAEKLNADQINILGNFLAAVAAALLTIAAELASEQSNNNGQNNGQKQK